MLDLPAVVEGPIAGKTAVVVVWSAASPPCSTTWTSRRWGPRRAAVPAAKAVLRNLGARHIPSPDPLTNRTRKETMTRSVSPLPRLLLLLTVVGCGATTATPATDAGADVSAPTPTDAATTPDAALPDGAAPDAAPLGDAGAGCWQALWMPNVSALGNAGAGCARPRGRRRVRG